MSIKIVKRIYSEDIKKELSTLLEWVKKQTPEILFGLQEIIFSTLRIIIDNSFRTEIASLRRNYNIPSDFYTNYQAANDDKHEEWLNKNSNKVPTDPWDKEIKKLCVDHNLDPNRYGEFILNYLYFGGVLPISEFVTLENTLTTDEPKYKTRLIVKFKDNRDLPEGVYIRIYKDTTINQIHEYINKNQRLIGFLRKLIDPFPKIRNRKIPLFKRDLEVFLLHSMGKHTKEIASLLDKEYNFLTDAEREKFYLEEPNIRKIASDMYKSIVSSFDS